MLRSRPEMPAARRSCARASCFLPWEVQQVGGDATPSVTVPRGQRFRGSTDRSDRDVLYGGGVVTKKHVGPVRERQAPLARPGQGEARDAECGALLLHAG